MAKPTGRLGEGRAWSSEKEVTKPGMSVGRAGHDGYLNKRPRGRMVGRPAQPRQLCRAKERKSCVIRRRVSRFVFVGGFLVIEHGRPVEIRGAPM